MTACTSKSTTSKHSNPKNKQMAVFIVAILKKSPRCVEPQRPGNGSNRARASSKVPATKFCSPNIAHPAKINFHGPGLIGRLRGKERELDPWQLLCDSSALHWLRQPPPWSKSRPDFSTGFLMFLTRMILRVGKRNPSFGTVYRIPSQRVSRK